MAGCGGHKDPVPIALALKPAPAAAETGAASPVQLVVTPFGDDRSDRTKLGIHQSMWGSTEPLTLKNGTVGEVTAKAFADYLLRKGWRVHYAPTPAEQQAGDVVISGKVLEASVDAHGTMGSTDIAAKHKLVVHANNRTDGSSITNTVSHTGTYTVFWYKPEDAEELLSEVMERNFDKFLGQVRFDGSALRFK
jgi:hypothetical protein